MAWYRAGGGGIPASLKTGMNDVLNKKFGTSTTYAPNTWPDNVNLLGKLPEKTVSGAIANIKDGADRVPVKNWQVTLNASLDGVSSLGCYQFGKNFCDDNLSNLEQGTINGTTGALENSNTRVRSINAVPFPYDEIVANYSFTIPSGYKIAIRPYDANGNFVAPPSWAQAFISNFPLDLIGQGIVSMKFVLAKTDNSAITPSDIKNVGYQIEVGSTATAYTPYVAPTVSTVNLGRTIYGGSVDVVAGTGTETHGLQTFDGTETWTLYETSFWYTSKPQTNVKSVHPCVTSNGVKITYTTTGQIRCYISENPGVVDTSTDMNALLSNGVSFNYQLNENVDFTFTPITPTPETKLGVNNFWADEGDSQVTYRRDIDLALGGG